MFIAMQVNSLSDLRRRIDKARRIPEKQALEAFLDAIQIDISTRDVIVNRAADWVCAVRAEARPSVLEAALEEYGLSTKEGVTLMCLAEALLRVPDTQTMDSLIEDKITAANWTARLGGSTSLLVNASTWALLLTGRVLEPRDEKPSDILMRMLKRLGEPVIRAATTRAIALIGEQFILGRDMDEALKRATTMQAKGYLYSFDMLGEAAVTMEDARHYFDSYRRAIQTLAPLNIGGNVNANNGISVKLSALHPRCEESRPEAATYITNALIALAQECKSANIGLNVDAEEIARLNVSLDIIDHALRHPTLANWDGFGVVVQAYTRAAPLIIDWLYALAKQTKRRIMARLVKGAYWDNEIKHAQSEGLDEFAVLTRKAATDVSYIANAQKLLNMTDWIYPQFATHNAHTMAAVLQLANHKQHCGEFEFQRLHGMGFALHEKVKNESGIPCRIYAPVGAHRDLLAYLVRRLLENGANSSFVNQIMDVNIPPKTVAACPLTKIETTITKPANPHITPPPQLFMPQRKNSRGWDLSNRLTIDHIENIRAPYQKTIFNASPIIANHHNSNDESAQRLTIINPANVKDIVGIAQTATINDCHNAIQAATPWTATPSARATILNKAAELLENRAGLFFALLAREAGKTIPDAVGEIREAADFLRYYASCAQTSDNRPPVGVFTCISPWNFPLAIFSGQIAAALAAGNATLAKPAEQTIIIGCEMIKLLHQSGVPPTALQFLPGDGNVIGNALVSRASVNGVAFTGSTTTAKNIHKTMARHLAPNAPLIAETGGINAMIIDSTALLEQATHDVIISAFQSAGQRCSALRVLYVQEDIMPAFQKMLFGAMDVLQLGDPWNIQTDIGPVIDNNAANRIRRYINNAQQTDRILKTLTTPDGLFIPPTVIKVSGIEEVKEEIFGPILHLASFQAKDIDAVADAVNNSGYGLTFGLNSRIDARVEALSAKLKIGNIYVNRNQIGAAVGSQPFGGEGLSGTGPKAGGARYLSRYQITIAEVVDNADDKNNLSSARLAEIRQSLINAPQLFEPRYKESLPGPTGELNLSKLFPRGVVLCMGPGDNAAREQAAIARQAGCVAIKIPEGAALKLDNADELNGFAAVFYWGKPAQKINQQLAARAGPIIPLITSRDADMLSRERHLCINTTAAGGNIELWTKCDAT